MVSSMRAAGDRVTGTGRGALFDAAYYSERLGPNPYTRNEVWLRFFRGIADEVVRSLRPSRVFDAGCAMGMLVESFWDLGVEAWGADISAYAISCVRRDMQPYCRVASIAEPLGNVFDLITCIEVLEHMPEEEARQAIAQMVEASDLVLFSSTPDDLNAPTHINVHPIVYWLKLFGEFGFTPDLTYDAGFICPHAILFRKARYAFDEQMLVSFSQKLRLKISLVERDQRIAGLNSHIEQLTATNTELMEQAGSATRFASEALERAAAAAKNAAELAAAELAAARSAAEREAAAAHSRLMEAENRAASLAASNAALVDRLDAASNARLTAEHSLARALETANSIPILEAETRSLADRNAQLTRTAFELKSALTAIHQSPGWQVVARYRTWLTTASVRRAWVSRWWEPAASRLLRLLTHRGFPDQVPGTSDSGAATSETELLSYANWILLNEPSSADLAIQRQNSLRFSFRPKISILVPVYKVSRTVLSDTIDSVRHQTYDHWELCIVHAVPDAADQRAWLATLAASDGRIKVKFLDSNLGISGNSNRALAMSTGEFLALLDHDDTLAPFALFEVVERLNRDPLLDFIFSDKDQLSEDGRRRMEPLFKPAWSPELILCANYLTHLCVLRTERVRSIGGWRSETDGAQDWDLFVRAIDDAQRVAHIPKILYHWRRVSTSVSANGFEAKPYAAAAQLATIQDCLQHRQWDATAVFSSSGIIQLRWNMEQRPRAAVITVSSDARQDIPSSDPAIELLTVNGARTGLASRLNDAVRQTSAEFLIFLDAGVQPAVDTWLGEIIAPLRQPGVAIVGCKLLDSETGQIRHAGICFNSDGELDYPFASDAEYVHNEFGGANWYRNWLAVSGACFGIRRDVFESVDGFSAEPAFPRLDVDLCLKVLSDPGRRIFYNPFARMWQSRRAALESWLSEGPAAGAKYIKEKFPHGDPFFNLNLASRQGRITLRNVREASPSRYEGQLVRRPGPTPEDGKVYIVRNGIRHWVIDHRWTLQNGFHWPNDVKVIPPGELDPIPRGEPFNYIP